MPNNHCALAYFTVSKNSKALILSGTTLVECQKYQMSKNTMLENGQRENTTTKQPSCVCWSTSDLFYILMGKN